MNKHRTITIIIAVLLGALFFDVRTSAAEIPVPDSGKGLVVFYRIDSFKGKAIRFEINHAEGSVGQLLSGTYLYRNLAPGKHTFWSQAISQDSITVSVEAGKTYYVKGEVKMGAFAGRPKFSLAPESDALAALAKM